MTTRITECTFTVRRIDPDELLTDDSVPHDVTPDDCWRCDAIPATTPVGLCDVCHHDFSEEPS